MGVSSSTSAGLVADRSLFAPAAEARRMPVVGVRGQREQALGAPQPWRRTVGLCRSRPARAAHRDGSVEILDRLRAIPNRDRSPVASEMVDVALPPPGVDVAEVPLTARIDGRTIRRTGDRASSHVRLQHGFVNVSVWRDDAAGNVPSDT